MFAGRRGIGAVHQTTLLALLMGVAIRLLEVVPITLASPKAAQIDLVRGDALKNFGRANVVKNACDSANVGSPVQRATCHLR
jgi:hypothetical protein